MDGFMMDTGPAKAFLVYSNIIEKYANLAAGITLEDNYDIGIPASASIRNPAFEPCRQGASLMESAEQLNQALRQKRHAMGLPEEWDDLIDNDDAVPLDDLLEIFEDENQISDKEETANTPSTKKSKKEEKSKKREKELCLNKKKKPLSRKICNSGKIKLNCSFKANRSFKKNKNRTSLNHQLKIAEKEKKSAKSNRNKINGLQNTKQKTNKDSNKQKNKIALSSNAAVQNPYCRFSIEDKQKVADRSARLKKRERNINLKKEKDLKKALDAKSPEDIQKAFEKIEMNTSITISEKVKLRHSKCQATGNSALVEKKTKPLIKYSNKNDNEKESVPKSENNGQLHINDVNGKVQNDKEETANTPSTKKSKKEEKRKKKKKELILNKRKSLLSREICISGKIKLNRSFKGNRSFKKNKNRTSLNPQLKNTEKDSKSAESKRNKINVLQNTKRKNNKDNNKQKNKITLGSNAAVQNSYCRFSIEDKQKVSDRSARLKQRERNLNLKKEKLLKKALDTKIPEDIQKAFEKMVMDSSITISGKVKLRHSKRQATRNSALVEKKSKPLIKYTNKNDNEKESVAKSKHQSVKEFKSQSGSPNNENNGQLHINVGNEKVQSIEDNGKLPLSKDDVNKSPNIEDNGQLHISDRDGHLHTKEDEGQLLSSKEDNGKLPHSEDNSQVHRNEGIYLLQSNDGNRHMHNKEGNNHSQNNVNNDEILTNENNDVLLSNEDNGQLHNNLLQVEENLEPVKKHSRNYQSIIVEENNAQNIKTIKGKSHRNIVNQDNKQLSNKKEKSDSDSNTKYIKQKPTNEFGKYKYTLYSERSKNKFKKLSTSNKKFSQSNIALIGLTYCRQAFMKVYENHASTVDPNLVIKFLKEKELEKLLIIKPSNQSLKEKYVCTNENESNAKTQITCHSMKNKRLIVNLKENKSECHVKNINNLDNPVNNVNNVVESSNKIENKISQIRSDQEKATGNEDFVINNKDYCADSGLLKERQCLPVEKIGLDHMEANVQEQHVPNINHSKKGSVDKQIIRQFCQREGTSIEAFKKIMQVEISLIDQQQIIKSQLNENDSQVMNKVQNFQSRSNKFEKSKEFDTLIELVSSKSNILKNKERNRENETQQKSVSEKEIICQDLILEHAEINSKTQTYPVEVVHQKQGETHELNSEVNSQYEDASKKTSNDILYNEGKSGRTLNDVYEDINKKNEDFFSLELLERGPEPKANTIEDMNQNQLKAHALNSEVNTKDKNKNENNESKIDVEEDKTVRTLNIAFEDVNGNGSAEEITTEKAVKSPIKQSKNKKSSEMKSESKVKESNVNKDISKERTHDKAENNTKENQNLGNENCKKKNKKTETERILKSLENTFVENIKNSDDLQEKHYKKHIAEDTDELARTNKAENIDSGNDKAENIPKENQNMRNVNRKKKNEKSKTERKLKSLEKSFVENLKNSDDIKEYHNNKCISAETVASERLNNEAQNNVSENINLENENFKMVNKKSKINKAESTRIIKKGKNKEVENIQNSDDMNNDTEVKGSDLNCHFSMGNNTRYNKFVTEHDICENFECEKWTNKNRTKVNKRNLNKDMDIKNNKESTVETEASQRSSNKEEKSNNIRNRNFDIGNCNKKNKKTKMSNIENIGIKKRLDNIEIAKQKKEEKISDSDNLKSRFRCRKKMNYYESCDDIDYESDTSGASWKDSKEYISSELNSSKSYNESNSESLPSKNKIFDGINRNERSVEYNDACLIRKTKIIIGDNEKSIHNQKVKKKLRLKYYITPPKNLHKTRGKKGKTISLSSNRCSNNSSKLIIDNNSSSNTNMYLLNQSNGFSSSSKEMCSQKIMSDSSSQSIVDYIAVDNSSKPSSCHTEKNQNLTNSPNIIQVVNTLNVIDIKEDTSKSLLHGSADIPERISHILQANSSVAPEVPESTFNEDKTNSSNKNGSIDRKILTTADNCTDKTSTDMTIKTSVSQKAKNKKLCPWDRMTDNSHKINLENLTMKNLSKDAFSDIDEMQHISNSTNNSQVKYSLNVVYGNEGVCGSLSNMSDIRSKIGSKNVLHVLKASGSSEVSESTHDQVKDNSKNKDSHGKVNNHLNNKDSNDEFNDHLTNKDMYKECMDNSRNKDKVDSKVNTISRKSFEGKTEQTENPSRIDHLCKPIVKKVINMNNPETESHKEIEKKGNSVANITEKDTKDHCVDLRNIVVKGKVSEDNVLPKESVLKKSAKLGQFLKPLHFQNNMIMKKAGHKKKLKLDYKKLLSDDKIIAGIDPQKKKRKQKDHMIFDSTHKYITEGKAAFCSIAELRKKNREALGMVPNKSASQVSKGIEEISAIEAETTEKLPIVNASEQIVANSKLLNRIGSSLEIETTKKLPAISENEEQSFQTGFERKEMSKRFDISKCSTSSEEDATVTLLGSIRPLISSHSYPSISSMVRVARTKSQSSVSEIYKNSSAASSDTISVSAKLGIKNFMELDDSDGEADTLMNDYISTSSNTCLPSVCIPPHKRPRIESNALESGFESGYTHYSSHLSSGYTTSWTQHSSRLSSCLKAQMRGSMCSSALKNTSSFKKPRLKIAKPR